MTVANVSYFAVWATDRGGMDAVRSRVREEHRQRLRTAATQGIEVMHGGPTLGADAQRMNGTLLIVKAPTLETVQRFIDGDPYVREGVYESVLIRPWAWSLGRPVD